MIVVDVDRASLARVRLAPSAAQELMAWLRLTVADGRHPVYGAPTAAARRSLAHPDVALIASLVPTDGAGYVPDLLTPQPPTSHPMQALADQLDLVGASDAELVSRQVGYCVDFGRRLPPGTVDAVASGTFAARAANGMRTFWKEAISEGWGTLREVLDGDIASRSEVLAKRGVGDVLGSLHRELKWDGQRISVRKPYDERREIAGADLILSHRPRLARADRPGLHARRRGVLLPGRRDRAAPAVPAPCARRADRPEPRRHPPRPRRTSLDGGAQRPTRAHPAHCLAPPRRACCAPGCSCVSGGASSCSTAAAREATT